MNITLNEQITKLDAYFRGVEQLIVDYKKSPSKEEEIHLIVLIADVFDAARVLAEKFDQELIAMENDGWLRETCEKAGLVYDKALAIYGDLNMESTLQTLGLNEKEKKRVSRVLKNSHGILLKTGDNKFSIYELLEMDQSSRTHAMPYVLEAIQSLTQSIKELNPVEA